MQSAVHGGTALGPDSKPVRTREILRELATGQLATIQLVREVAEDGTARRAVMKRIRPELANLPGWTDLLTDEALLLASISHPNVVACYDAGREAGTYVVLQHVDGDSLDGLLRRSDIWRWPKLLVTVLADALRGLSAVHAATTPDGLPLGLVHQAPRARHILVGADGRARIADFTQARVQNLPPRTRHPERLKGHLVAPELLDYVPRVDARADLFVLGATMWEALSGETLLKPSGEDLRRQLKRVRRPSESSFAPPTALDDVCLRALSIDPRDRFASAKEMLDELLGAAERAGGLAPPSEIAQWLNSTDGMSQAIDAKGLQAAGGRTLSGPSGPPMATPRPRRETISYDAAPKRAEPEPIHVQPRYNGATLQGFETVGVRAKSPEPQVVVENHPRRAEDPLADGRGDEGGRSEEQRETERRARRLEERRSEARRLDNRREPTGRFRETRAEDTLEPNAPDRTASERARESGGRSSFSDLGAFSVKPGKAAPMDALAWACSVALVALTLFVGDYAVAAVLPWPEVELEDATEQDAQDELTREFSAFPSFPADQLPRKSPPSASPTLPPIPTPATKLVPMVKPPAMQAPRPRQPRAPTISTPTAPAAEEGVPENPY